VEPLSSRLPTDDRSYIETTTEGLVLHAQRKALFGMVQKVDSHLLCEAPFGPFRQKVAVTFLLVPSRLPASVSGDLGGLG
jgi:hypothetical protein